jgi:hypothetical protein
MLPITPAADLRAVCGGPIETHTEVVSSGNHAYSVRMGGRIDGEMTRDPVGYWAFDQYWEPNLAVRLENTGSVPVVNPWLRAEGRPDTRSVRAIVDWLVNPSMSERERARRIWEFEIQNRFHATTNDDEVEDAVKRFNVYGYTLCGPESRVLSDLWRAAGLRVRRGYPNGHETAEVSYEGAWHLLDSDESIICLLRDNKTIASEKQIVEDHDLMKRTHTYGPLHDDDRLRDETSAALHFYEGARSGEQPSRTKHNMDYVLRPGEAITWAWNLGNRFHGLEYPGGDSDNWIKRWRLAAQVMNGELTWSPDFTREETLKYVDARGVELLKEGPFGAGLYVIEGSGVIELAVKSPYPIVGGRLDVDFGRRDLRREQVRASVSFDGGKGWRPMWTSSPTDYARMYVDLNGFFPATDPARYEYRLRLELSSQAEQPAVCLKNLSIHSTLQMARLAMPGVKLGNNSFTYSDQSDPARTVRITHSWKECDAAVPEPPAGAIYPPDGGKAEGTRIRFRWLPPSSGPAPADYEFQLSEYPDMRWVLSPNFRKLISRTAHRGTASFELPYRGLLNPDETYYWRVRARTGEGVWGPWSKVFSFSTITPAVPVNVVARFDPKTRTARLAWEPGAGGQRPARYRVYGGAERGFSPSETPFRYNAGAQGTKDSPPNLLLETRTAAVSLDLAPELWRSFYRVAAIDSEGRESGASDLAEMAHPLILARRLPDGRSSSYYQAAVEVSASIGHLTSANRNGRPYHMMYRTGDELAFSLSSPLSGLSIDPRTGLIAGFLPQDSAGTYELVITVTDQRTGNRDAVTLRLNVM